jgi:hypothetical protein
MQLHLRLGRKMWRLARRKPGVARLIEEWIDAALSR